MISKNNKRYLNNQDVIICSEKNKTDVGNSSMHMLSFLLKFSLEIISIFKRLEKQWKKKDVQYKYHVLILSGKWYRQYNFSYNVLEFMLIRKILYTLHRKIIKRHFKGLFQDESQHFLKRRPRIPILLETSL